MSGTRDETWFEESGRRTVSEWAQVLDSSGMRLDGFRRVLDFGCGCGRALRHLPERLMPGHHLHGLDTDSEAVAWLKGALPDVTVGTLDPFPPAPLPDASVDLILSHSVFTHLPEEIQFAWLQELRRLLVPDGILVTSIHGSKAFEDFLRPLPGTPLEPMSIEARAAMGDKGFFHLLGRTAAERSYPQYYGAAFHSVEYIARSWLRFFDLVAWHPTMALDFQDILVMRPKIRIETKQYDRDAAPRRDRQIDVDRYFKNEARRQAPCSGQNNAAFQDALTAYHASITPGDCTFYHVVDLGDGRRFGGEWDLRGHEEAYLGGQSLAGKKVIEFGPASGWLSQHMARRGATLTVFDLPFGSAPDIMPFPGVDADACRSSGALDVARLRNSWWFTRRQMGFDATAIYADIYDHPSDLGSFDIAVFGSILLHLAHPFTALQRAAERTRETIVVTDVVGPQEDLHEQASGLAPDLALMAFGPTPPPIGVVHWWALSSRSVELMLRRLGFIETTVTRHPDLPLFTVVGHRCR